MTARTRVMISRKVDIKPETSQQEGEKRETVRCVENRGVGKERNCECRPLF